jgi:hypothetical protein
MPRVGFPSSGTQAANGFCVGPTTEFRELLERYEDLRDARRWRRNGKGNLVRELGFEVLTVFRRGGKVHWCSFEPGVGTRFSQRWFRCEQDALDDVAKDYVGLPQV